MRSSSNAFPRPTFQALGNVFGGATEGNRAVKQAGGGMLQPFRQTSGAPVGDEWLERFREWVESHKYYPEQAAELGQQGVVAVEIRVAPNGQVTDLELRERSGSPWLDLGLQALFRDARVPPLPPGSADSVTFQVTMTYQLIE
jgi:TonB family protein